jgi:acetyl-CoA synthetase
MTNMRSYEEEIKDFNWTIAEKELEYKPGAVINIGEYCSDRICRQGKGEKLALIWEGHVGEVKQYTFNDMRLLTNTIAQYLKNLGLQPGERVCLFMDKVPELYFGFLAILKMGGIAQPLFSAFGAESLLTRLADAGTAAIITQKKHVAKVRALLKDMPGLRHIIIVDDDKSKPLREREIALDMEKEAKIETFASFPTTAETPSVLHYTSGTTGKPKGAQHVHYSLISQYITAKFVLDLKDDDIYWCTADPGWVTGMSYGIVAPLLHGVTSIVDEAEFDAQRWYRTLQEQAISVWYTAPTAVRMLMKAGSELARQHCFPSLRFIASVGEPLNPEAVWWGKEVLGLPIHDNWWQTETGGIMIANTPAFDIKPGSMGRPLPGIDAAIVKRQEDGSVKVIEEANVEGELALKAGWPSMFRSYLNNEERYRKCFAGPHNEWYLSGDLAKRDADGYFWFVGRADDVIKSAGHLIGPFEVESALMEHPAVAEAGVIGKPDPMVGEIVKAFVSLNKGFEDSETLRRELLGHARKKLGAAVAPKEIGVLSSLPRTRSGKIMRRLLKARELGLPEGDLSTLESGG